jgi:hypothetical protein
MYTRTLCALGWVLAGLVGLGLTGCDGFQITFDNGGRTPAERLDQAVGPVQTTDPRTATLPDPLVQQGDTIIINQEVNIIVDPAVDLVVEELPDETVLGIDNQTGFDMYIRYLADADLQGVYVYDGETLLLDYPCLGRIELLSEDDIDPDTLLLVDSFDLTDSTFVNPDDFICGDALIITFDPLAITVDVNAIDLLP